MIEELKRKLADEAAKLMHELNVTLPAEIRKAVEHGDLRENSEYKAALERQQFVQARLGHLHGASASSPRSTSPRSRPTGWGWARRSSSRTSDEGARELHADVRRPGGVRGGAREHGLPDRQGAARQAIGETAILKLPTSVRRLRVVELVTITSSRQPRARNAVARRRRAGVCGRAGRCRLAPWNALRGCSPLRWNALVARARPMGGSRSCWNGTA
jgi:transcription elongation factor GreA